LAANALLQKGLNRATAKSSEAGLRGSEIPVETQLVSRLRSPAFPFFGFRRRKTHGVGGAIEI